MPSLTSCQRSSAQRGQKLVTSREPVTDALASPGPAARAAWGFPSSGPAWGLGWACECEAAVPTAHAAWPGLGVGRAWGSGGRNCPRGSVVLRVQTSFLENSSFLTALSLVGRGSIFCPRTVSWAQKNRLANRNCPKKPPSFLSTPLVS